MKSITTKLTVGTENGEKLSCSIIEHNNGTFTAVTFSRSKNFKTLKGAEKWLSSNMPSKS